MRCAKLAAGPRRGGGAVGPRMPREPKVSRGFIHPGFGGVPGEQSDSCLYRRLMLAPNAVSQSYMIHRCSALYALITTLSRAERPFQAIWTPIQSKMNAITRRMPWAVEAGMALETFGAYA